MPGTTEWEGGQAGEEVAAEGVTAEVTGGEVSIAVLYKALRIIEGLAGREYDPMSLAELAERSKLDKSGVYRILRTLEANGWAEQRDKLWRLSHRLIGLAEAYRLGRDRFYRKLDETDRNYLGRTD